MKILHLHLSGEYAGSERYCADLASAQVGVGEDVHLGVRAERFEGRWRRDAAGAQVWASPRWGKGPLEVLWVLLLMWRLAPDVVHTHLGKANRLAALWARMLGIVWVATVHLRWKDKEMRGADGVVCIAGWQRAEIARDYLGRVEVIWNWLPEARQRFDKASVEALRAQWGAGAETFVFGSVGRLHHHKGMDVLVRAFKQVFANGEDVRLVIVGEGRQREELETLAAGDERIKIVGYRDDVDGFYPAFDVYASAARYEPFGLTLLEAMAHGKPLICTETQGPREFLRDHEVAWALPGDVEEMAIALRLEFGKGKRRVGHDVRPFLRGVAVAKVLDFYKLLRGV